MKAGRGAEAGDARKNRVPGAAPLRREGKGKRKGVREKAGAKGGTTKHMKRTKPSRVAHGIPSVATPRWEGWVKAKGSEGESGVGEGNRDEKTRFPGIVSREPQNGANALRHACVRFRVFPRVPWAHAAASPSVITPLLCG